MRGNGEECRVVNGGGTLRLEGTMSSLLAEVPSVELQPGRPQQCICGQVGAVQWLQRVEYDSTRGREVRGETIVVNQPSSLERQHWTKKEFCIVE